MATTMTDVHWQLAIADAPLRAWLKAAYVNVDTDDLITLQVSNKAHFECDDDAQGLNNRVCRSVVFNREYLYEFVCRLKANLEAGALDQMRADKDKEVSNARPS